ncbi:MAG TPA: acyltransferase, partial [Chitinophagaceae bacterium]|nr:acyltransferase [Chitinophagaceae bacterium]
FSLRNRSIGGFLKERTLRLLIPLLFAMFFTIPLQVWVEYSQKGRINMDYLSFYPTVWDFIPYPEGTLTWSHMWFVVYLFCFILLLSPLFALFKLRWLNHAREKVSAFLSHPLATIALVIPLMIIYYYLYLPYPIQGSLLDDWFLFSFSITFLLYGFFLGSSESFWQNCARYRNHYLVVAAIAVIILFAMYWWPLNVPKENNELFRIYVVLNCCEIWASLLAICGYAKKYLSNGSNALSYLNKAVYPYYIIHQTVIVFLGYYIVNWNMHLLLKFFILTVLSLLLIFSIYHFIIRKTRLTGFLFGVKG